jgi:hypothetical protein
MLFNETLLTAEVIQHRKRWKMIMNGVVTDSGGGSHNQFQGTTPALAWGD